MNAFQTWLARLALLSLCGGAGPGCEPTPTAVATAPAVRVPPDSKPIPLLAPPLTSDQVIAIARADYLTRHPQVDPTGMKLAAEQDNDGAGWSVRFEDDPPRPGGHRVIQLDPTGKVLQFWGGR